MLIHRGNYAMWEIIKNEGAYSWCKCSCGKEMKKQTSTVLPGTACAVCEKESRRKFIDGIDDRFIAMLDNMKGRCYRPNHPSYDHYGARGITICDEWLSDTKNFVNWAHVQQNNHLTIERRDNELGYSPGNCYFATRTEQNRNRRNATWVEYNGERMLIAEAARASGVKELALRNRIKKYPDQPDVWFHQGFLPKAISHNYKKKDH